MEAFRSVPTGVGDDFPIPVTHACASRVLCGDDHLVSDTTLGHPLANRPLRLSLLVVDGSKSCQQWSIRRW